MISVELWNRWMVAVITYIVRCCLWKLPGRAKYHQEQYQNIGSADRISKSEPPMYGIYKLITTPQTVEDFISLEEFYLYVVLTFQRNF
jgi:hypothetical protein